MIAFSHLFPEIGPKETRVIIIPEGIAELKAGRYVFLEYYCDDLSCDCRRAILTVVEESQPGVGLASINFGWESEEFYTRWMHGDREAGREIKNASLDPLNPMAPCASALLDLFQTVLMKDANYVRRLETHYSMLKGVLRATKAKPKRQKGMKRPKRLGW